MKISNKFQTKIKKLLKKIQKFKNSNKTFISLNILNILGRTSLLRLPTISGFSPCVHVFINASGFFSFFFFFLQKKRKKERRKKEEEHREHSNKEEEDDEDGFLVFFGENR